MDQAFLLRAERILARELVPAIDHGILVAALAAHQAASPTARAASSSGGFAHWDRPNEALAELLGGGPCWREARLAQRGSFHRRRPGADGKER